MASKFYPVTLTDLAPTEVNVRTQPYDHGTDQSAITTIDFGTPYSLGIAQIQPEGLTAREQLLNAITLGRHIVEQAAALLAELEPANDPEADLAEVAAALDADIDEMPPLDVLDPVSDDVPGRVEGDEVAA